jgi:hypothetical protein
MFGQNNKDGYESDGDTVSEKEDGEEDSPMR